MQLKHLRKDAKLLQSHACRETNGSKLQLAACEHEARQLVKRKQKERRRALYEKKSLMIAARRSQQKLKDELMRLDVLTKVTEGLKKKKLSKLLEKANHSNSTLTKDPSLDLDVQLMKQNDAKF